MESERAAAHFEDLANEHDAGRFAMWVFIGSEVLFFAALFTLFAGFRAHYPREFAEAAQHSNLTIGSANTYVLITSSLLVALSVDAIRRDRARAVLWLLSGAGLLGLLFLFLKSWEYAEHFREGIFPGVAYRFEELPARGAMLFFTLYYVATGIHALHVIVGLGLFAWVARRTWRGLYSSRAHQGLELTALYWHLVDVIWIFLWPAFYLIR